MFECLINFQMINNRYVLKGRNLVALKSGELVGYFLWKERGCLNSLLIFDRAYDSFLRYQFILFFFIHVQKLAHQINILLESTLLQPRESIRDDTHIIFLN